MRELYPFLFNAFGSEGKEFAAYSVDVAPELMGRSPVLISSWASLERPSFTCGKTCGK